MSKPISRSNPAAAGADHADDAACGTGEDGVLALKAGGFGQAAVRLHEHQPFAAAPMSKRAFHLIAT
jgi:hypothetical protein